MDIETQVETLPIKYCPRCGEARLRPHAAKAVHCAGCGFKYFHNNAAATGTVIRCGDHVLFVERGRDPAKGLIDVPGGFVDYGETLEQAAIRETHEEVGVQLKHVEYLASFPNVYRYSDVVYQTCDVYFQVRLPERPTVRAGDDAAACHWLRPADLAPPDLAFDSVRRLVRLLALGGHKL